VRDALIHVYSAAPDTNDASDMYVRQIDGVKNPLPAARRGGRQRGRRRRDRAVGLRLPENIGRPKGTALVADVNGNVIDYRF
jgi:hypothetical protein